MDINKFLQSKTFKITTCCVSIFIALSLVFSLGFYVGARKADHSFKWAEQYHRNFAGPENGFFQNIIKDEKNFIESNGIFGKIIKIENNTITVIGQKDIEQIILITDETAIKKQNENIDILSLNINDQIIVIGNPNENGQIEAALIRIMPTKTLPKMPGFFIDKKVEKPV